jgi:hypothetical protein
MVEVEAPCVYEGTRDVGRSVEEYVEVVFGLRAMKVDISNSYTSAIDKKVNGEEGMGRGIRSRDLSV